MILRFGYVAMSMELANCSPSKAVTFKTYSGLRERDPEAAMNKLTRTSRENLFNTIRLLRHNKANNVRLYRFSSKIIPLATHPELEGWDFIEGVRDLLGEIGILVKENHMRVSFHPDHYTLINSPREDVFNASVKDYIHHCLILEGMGLDNTAKLVTHVGGGYKDKKKSLDKFIKNWGRVPARVTERIALENDDKTFTAEDTLYLAEKLGLPMVFDLHHFMCNREEGSRTEDILPRFLCSWKGSGLNPKIHVSSPRSESDIRSHHDYVNPLDVYGFIKEAAVFNKGIDVMVEAKQKDFAMFRLIRELSEFPGIKRINEASLEVNLN
ncbi:MAG: UV DNA damage repair endonuclease UvsE [Bacillota bacterium]